jgi:hypothetical protein
VFQKFQGLIDGNVTHGAIVDVFGGVSLAGNDGIQIKVFKFFWLDINAEVFFGRDEFIEDLVAVDLVSALYIFFSLSLTLRQNKQVWSD